MINSQKCFWMFSSFLTSSMLLFASESLAVNVVDDEDAAPPPAVTAPDVTAPATVPVPASTTPSATNIPPVGANPTGLSLSNMTKENAKDAVKKALVDGIISTSEATGVDSKVLAKGGQMLVNAVSQTNTPVPVDNFRPSFGDWKYSLLFSDVEVERLRKTITTGEKFLLNGEEAVPVANEDDEIAKLLAAEEEKNQKEPIKISYPSFHLHSIAYSSPKVWSVWVNNQMLTDDTPETDDGLKVEHISEEKVDFTWTPPKEFVEALKKLEMQQKTATKPAPVPYDAPSRIAIDTKQGGYDKKLQVMSFSLRPNQVFFTETYHVFEGLPKNLNFVDAGAAVSKEGAEVADEDLVKPTSPATGRAAALKNNGDVDNAVANVVAEKQSPKAKMEQAIDKALNGGETAAQPQPAVDAAKPSTVENKNSDEAPKGIAAKAGANAQAQPQPIEPLNIENKNVKAGYLEAREKASKMTEKNK
jgi:hypothetical protein